MLGQVAGAVQERVLRAAPVEFVRSLAAAELTGFRFCDCVAKPPHPVNVFCPRLPWSSSPSREGEVTKTCQALPPARRADRERR